MRQEDEDLAPTATVEGPGGLWRSSSGAAPLARGAAVGRYLILDLLGAGGMGVVYAGYDPELDRKVALKLLRPERTVQGERARRWLQREAQAAARLSHPNVITIYDVGLLGDDRVFVAMELVAGQTLRQWMDAGPHSWREVVDLLLSAGRGLAAAHAAGLVHRDFKPDNVLLGDDGRVRVADFGLAFPDEKDGASGEHAEQGGEALTRWGALVGTLAYMAPEQLHGEDHPDLAYDFQGIGLALWWQGRYPEASPPLERAVALRESHPVSPSLLAESRFFLARNLIQGGGDRARARRLLLQAREGFGQMGNANNLQQLEPWLERAAG